MSEFFELGNKMESPTGSEPGKWFANEVTLASVVQADNPKFSEVELECKYPSPKDPGELWSFYVSGSFKRDPKTRAKIGGGSMFRVNNLFVATGVKAEMMGNKISPRALMELQGKKVVVVRYYNGEKWKSLAYPFPVGTSNDEIQRAVDSEMNYASKSAARRPNVDNAFGERPASAPGTTPIVDDGDLPF
jgi:hypothetical protein